MKTNEEIIRACYAAYERKDRAAIEALLAPDFTFTSPLDDCISRERYFERCWPNSEHIDSFRIEKLFVNVDEAFVQYQLHPKGNPPFRNTEFFTLRDGKITHVDVYFGAETGEEASQEEIGTVLDARAEAMRCKDVEKAVACFAPDAVRFTLAPPLQSDEPLAKDFTDWFATFEGGLGWEDRDRVIHVQGDVAWCHVISHMTGAKKDGAKMDLWFRETLGLRASEGRWLIAHSHESVPFLMDGSFKAALTLKPD